ncbi:MAG: zinc ribbon domain-containing protein [Acidobacteria bacterium]|nr:zinc ribbon domain-containing protein [Acidobacteriota bacterium]
MPIYEYRCKKCGHTFERIQKFSDRQVRTCPECKGRVERVVNAPAIQFKGTGWYVTDYADKSGGKSDKGARPAARIQARASRRKSRRRRSPTTEPVAPRDPPSRAC